MGINSTLLTKGGTPRLRLVRNSCYLGHFLFYFPWDVYCFSSRRRPKVTIPSRKAGGKCHFRPGGKKSRIHYSGKKIRNPPVHVYITASPRELCTWSGTFLIFPPSLCNVLFPVSNNFFEFRNKSCRHTKLAHFCYFIWLLFENFLSWMFRTVLSGNINSYGKTTNKCILFSFWRSIIIIRKNLLKAHYIFSNLSSSKINSSSQWSPTSWQHVFRFLWSFRYSSASHTSLRI